MAHPPILYREVRVAPPPASSSSILHIDASSGSQRTSLLRAGSKRTFDEISGLDEEGYARKHLATEGSVFFRSKLRSPRSFLWRILDDRKVLEVQAVDLVKENTSNGQDSWLTYRVGFKDRILERGVAFADPEETDALECFVITESRELFTVTLKRDLLTMASVPAEFDAGRCVKKYASSFLSMRHPYRFVAVSSLELLVSLADGGLVRLERRAGESGAQWRDTFFSEGGWSGTFTLKRINPFSQHQTVRYGDLELDHTAVADMAKSPDGKYVWTVSLDHWLRAWSTSTGKIVAKMDLLNQSEDSHRRQPYIMSAEQSTLLQIVRLPASPDSQAVARTEDDNKYYIVVQSPKDHQLKFYDVSYTFSSMDGEAIRVNDLQSRNKLVPPIDELMNTNIWHLEQFYVQPGFDWRDTQLWVRARSGALCRTFMLTFDLLEDSGDGMDVRNIWQDAWSVVDEGPTTSEELKHCAGYPGDLDITADDGVTPNEKWLAFLFYPNRFSIFAIESALHIYRKGRGLPATSSRGIKAAEQALEERLTTAVTSKVLLRRLPNEQPDYTRYQQDIQSQWQTFYSLISHLHNRRHESIGLAFDAEDGVLWTVCADSVAPIRECSGLELRSINTHLLDSEAAEKIDRVLHHRLYPEYIDVDNKGTPYESVFLSRLLAAARELRQSLSGTVQEKLRLSAAADALNMSEEVQQGRAVAMFERCGLESEVTDEDFDALALGVESLGGLGSLADASMLGLMEWIDAEGRIVGRESNILISRFGPSVAVATAEESLRHAQSIILDVLALVVFMAGGLETEELDPDFDPDRMYNAAMHRLKRIELFLWLAGHARENTIEPEPEVEISSEVTLFEDIFIGDWCPWEPAREDANMSTLLTVWGKAWITGLSTTNWDGVTAHVLAFLLRRNELKLAVDFLPFTTDASAWSTYVKARLHVALGEYAQASLEFQTAAEGCAALETIKTEDGARLLSPEEHNYFGSGLAVYFQHVTAVFEKLKVYSYVADFARLALQHTEPLPNFARSMAKLDRQKRQFQNSPIADRVAVSQEEQRLLRIKEARDEILNRLFNALDQTGRFKEAYDALAQIETPPMKKQALRKLLDSCVKQDAVPTLLELPFEGELALEADKMLLETAKKDLASGTTSRATPAYQTLYAFRTQRSDFRGAAEILYEHLERLRNTPHHHAVQDPEDETLTQVYVLLINTLACCGGDEAWLLADPIPGVHKEGRKRRLVKLADLRREYTAELDKRSDMLHGRFALVGGGGEGDEMDVL